MMMVTVVMMMTTESSGPSWNLQQRAAISLLACKLQVELFFLGKVWDVTQPYVFFVFFCGFSLWTPNNVFFFYSFETPPPQKKNTSNSTVDPAVESFFWLRDLQRRPLWSLRTKNWSKGATCVVAFVGLEDLVEHLELLATRNSGEVSMVKKSL